jgi:hypothetical protein
MGPVVMSLGVMRSLCTYAWSEISFSGKSYILDGMASVYLSSICNLPFSNISSRSNTKVQLGTVLKPILAHYASRNRRNWKFYECFIWPTPDYSLLWWHREPLPGQWVRHQYCEDLPDAWSTQGRSIPLLPTWVSHSVFCSYTFS